jgi:hypothetical protein
MRFAVHVHEGIVTAILAAPTSGRTDTAMLVVRGMSLTFFGTALAGQRAGFQYGAQQRIVGASSSRRKLAGRKTNIGTVLIEPNALPELADHALG